ncbi:hypothetical protein GCM10027276_36790 [Comamonas piscis]
MAKRFAAAGPYLASAKGANASQQIGGVGGRLAKPNSIQPRLKPTTAALETAGAVAVNHSGVGGLRQALKDALQNPRPMGWARIGMSRKASFAVEP